MSSRSKLESFVSRITSSNEVINSQNIFNIHKNNISEEQKIFRFFEKKSIENSVSNELYYRLIFCFEN